jgi:hypothetical protein
MTLLRWFFGSSEEAEWFRLLVFLVAIIYWFCSQLNSITKRIR